MSEIVSTDEMVSMMRQEMEEIGRSISSSFRLRSSSRYRNLASKSGNSTGADNEFYALDWAAIERLPTYERLRTSLFDKDENEDMNEHQSKKVVDVTKLGALERRVFIEKLIKHIQDDNLQLLWKIRKRIDRVGVKLPTVEVRYKNLCVEAECQVVRGKALPTLWNSAKSALSVCGSLSGSSSSKARLSILNDVSGIIKPGRLTLLLGPPGCGKTTLLKALSGNLNQSLKVTGEISYNGYKLAEFVPQKTSAYISQCDLHIPEMTVRETLDFSSRLQGVGNRADIMLEVTRREKEAEILPEPDIDAYMKATSVKGLETTLQTDYMLKILGLDVCAETMVGSTIKRGISGGEKKRLTTGEMIVGPISTLFMDEITNGLDSSTAFQIVSCLQQLAHISNATILASLLQPAPEIFDLFDDIILMAERIVVYHGPREDICKFFEDCGFKCPKRKGVADFLQEVISRKDQEQYWYNTQLPYIYFTAAMFSRRFKESSQATKLDEELSKPYDKSHSHRGSLSFNVYSLSKWQLFQTCLSREFLLMRRNSFIYVFKTSQLIVLAFVTMTVFLRTRMHIDVFHTTYYMGSLFYALIMLLLNGFPELSMTVSRLAVFYKQRELCFYPAWTYAIVSTVLKIPLAIVDSFVWTSLTYYVIGYSPEISRFFRQFIILFAAHFMSTSGFRLLASVFQTAVASFTAGCLAMLLIALFGGFIIARFSIPVWLQWGFWISPMTYGEIALSLNEFLAPRWQKLLYLNRSIGDLVLESRGLDFAEYYFWISVGALFGFALVFNIAYALALSFLKPWALSPSVISHEKFSWTNRSEESHDGTQVEENSKQSTSSADKEYSERRMVLPFEPLPLTFQDVQYHVDTPLEMRERRFASKKLQLLSGVSGAFRPGILTALMGVSGAGKTTLLDVLAGRKSYGYIEGEIKISGYPKVQETFARISGYCEQIDTHSPQITVEESVIFSAWLRLASQIDSKTKAEFVNEVLETIELVRIKDDLVGVPGVNGLSTEQRRRLSIAVELVANPSIVFMDEPTTGLDARAAATVMRVVKNVADTGRTVVCTIHQPSIDIFEVFNELILLKPGGCVIYYGPLGHHSSKVIEYFENISSVPKIKSNYNPATWMLEITSPSSEDELGVDFATIYRDSALYKNNIELIRQLSYPPPGSSDLRFPTRFSQNGWGQFKSCVWKLHLSYWRSPSYNLVRITYTLVASLIFGLLLWRQGKKIDNQQNLLNILGSMYIFVLLVGLVNGVLVIPYVATERTVTYRERFSGMYAAWAYSLAQVTVEIPYSLIQAVAFVLLTYPMIGYYVTTYKVFWYFYATFSMFLYNNYLGMLLVSLTPNFMLATTLSSAFYTLFNLFSGFLIPQPKIPKWWIWLYYLVPTSWTLNGLLTSQYGDVEKEITVFGETKTVAAFLEDYFGFHHDRLPLTAVALLAFTLGYASLFAFFIGRLNFQQR
ncbi:Pleiotropic drug resistance 9 [Tripterygium wilfordii]|uniref:Pleiotropic drug resistance 9 n=1 Tax=Tripterygium wilfordii TaxID=458696 RepID=A0A7J7D105_TRIWF|nr:pleiotropic drug resistance protein 3-like isoform X1 [Tripterygium wilfordii]XP_038715447.1 pleiotropic drug resistance protein 3-like isoform X1 [Tripterygium wilfordii]XP_038715448.1 pleiotropic drug resistance protein 3-like isoform X1 [Tripterygium wilfordii]KAF5739958.1 Pleiotropic drug resistance 9 [Tripterygium wilfordii]